MSSRVRMHNAARPCMWMAALARLTDVTELQMP